MRQLNNQEIKQCELDILKYVDRICKENNIRYYLSYGTLIGAIRHKGFIPWDDDIDIAMPRNDYDKFLSLFENIPTTARYQCQIPLKNGYFYEFAKVHDTSTKVIESGVDSIEGGLWVDVFPLDGLKREDKLSHNMLRVLNRCRVASVHRKFPHKTKGILVVFEYIFWRICRLVGYRPFLKKSMALSKKYKYEECDYVGYASAYPGTNKYMKKEWFGVPIEVEFEGCKFKAPKRYHEYLSTQYGDYMQLPPVDKRLPHNMNAYKL